MKELEKIKAVLLDLDGVLVDSFDEWYSAFNDTLKHFRDKSLTKEEFRKKHWGPELKENMEKLGLGKKGENYCHSKYNDYIDRVKILPGAKFALKNINQKTCLVTSTLSDSVSKILNQLELDQYFDAIISADDVGNPKPAADPVIKACEMLEVKPQNAVLVGDTETDVKAGRKAGCKVIGVKTDGDMKIESIEELPKILSP